MRAIIASACATLLASCAQPARTQGPLFERGSSVAVGKGSGKVALIDVNRDGHLDLVTQHLLDSVVNVHIGDGKGAFVRAGSPIRLAYEPGTMALADVDNDGAVDIGIAFKSDSGEYVAILRGDGRGNFTHSLGTPVRTSAAMQFYKPILRLADVNHDRNIDIVMSNGRRHTIEVLLGDGTGRFTAQPVVRLSGPSQGLSSFTVGDVDGDGHVDLVATNSLGADLANMNTSRLLTRRGDGKGNFTDSVTSTVPPGAILENLADVTGDGRLDALFSHSDRRLVSIAVNSGKGAFTPSVPIQIGDGAQAFAILAGDVNADGKSDLITATVQNEVAPFASRVAVFLAGTGGFIPAAGSPFPAGEGSYNAALGDVNGDGKPDVASSSFGGKSVTLLVGRAR